jgi:hypothetical protein
VVLLATLVINQIAFKHRFANAFLKTTLHAGLFGGTGLAWWYYLQTTPPASILDFITTRTADLTVPVAFSTVLVFSAMLVGNLIAFNNRLTNVAATALVFALMYGGVVYAIRTLPLGGNLADLVFLRAIRLSRAPLSAVSESDGQSTTASRLREEELSVRAFSAFQLEQSSKRDAAMILVSKGGARMGRTSPPRLKKWRPR